MRKSGIRLKGADGDRELCSYGKFTGKFGAVCLDTGFSARLITRDASATTQKGLADWLTVTASLEEPHAS
jgi:hypothetical protein